MKPETKAWLNDRALIVRDWLVHDVGPWPLVAFVAGFVLGKLL